MCQGESLSPAAAALSSVIGLGIIQAKGPGMSLSDAGPCCMEVTFSRLDNLFSVHTAGISQPAYSYQCIGSTDSRNCINNSKVSGTRRATPSDFLKIIFTDIGNSITNLFLHESSPFLLSFSLLDRDHCRYC